MSSYDSRGPSPTEHCSQHGFYRPSGQGDIFLFSPGLCSRSSNDSASQSSSFDTFSYAYSLSPADLISAPNPFSPPSLPSPQASPSPLFVEAYLSGSEPKPILNPSTPFQELFNSSPAGYWQANDLSVSPISRHSDTAFYAAGLNDQSDDEEVVSGRIESLLQYERSRDIPDSPPARPSSPSTLSSLSSIPSSPSALFCGAPIASSQTSRGQTLSCSPSRRPSVLSPLGSPFKLHSPFEVHSKLPNSFCASSPRRSRRFHQAPRTGPRSLASEILNQLGQPRRAGPHSLASSCKPSSSSMPAVSDSDDENYEPTNGKRRESRKRSRPSIQRSPSTRKKRRTAPAASASTTTDCAPVSEDHEENATDQELPTYLNRTFPLRVPLHENFPLFYRRFPVSSVTDPALAGYDLAFTFRDICC